MSGGVVWMPGHGRQGRGADRDSARRQAPDDATRSPTSRAAAEGRRRCRTRPGLCRPTPGASPTRSSCARPSSGRCSSTGPTTAASSPGPRTGGRSLWPRSLRLARRGRAARPGGLRPTVSGPDRLTHPAHRRPTVGARQRRGGPARPRPGPGPGGRSARPALIDAGVDDPHRGARHRARRRGRRPWSGVVVDGRLERGRVVLATGGFQHDAALVGEFLPGPPDRPHGDRGVRAATACAWPWSVDAAVGNTTEGWWMPAMHVPGEEVDGVTHYRPLHSERAQPGAIMVDRAGGASSTRPRTTATWAGPCAPPPPGAPPGAPAGSGIRRAVLVGVRRPPTVGRYPVGPLEPGGARPGLARAAPTTSMTLAVDDRHGAGHPGRHGDALQRRRGTWARTPTSAGARFPTTVGSGTRAPPTPRWRHCARPPSTPWRSISAAWGPRAARAPTTGAACCRSRPAAVPGLYAAGNAAASPFGTATAAGGATLGPALVFGFRAGEAAAGDP